MENQLAPTVPITDVLSEDEREQKIYALVKSIRCEGNETLFPELWKYIP